MRNFTKRDFETLNCTINCSSRDSLNEFNIKEINSLFQDEIYNTVMMDKHEFRASGHFAYPSTD